VTVEKMTSGLHGMHFHKVGNCSDTHHFKTAEGHIDPYTKPHGYFHPEGPHEGNLPNLIVAENGKADVEIYTEMVSLNKNDKKKQSLIDADGSSLIIHANPDDHVSQPIGGSGDRIACGLIKSKY
jgi:Cu-Zn family superoxide dismutase